MGESNIEYVDNGWTVQEGCLFYKTDVCQCDCWAKAITKRAPQAHPKGFSPVFHSRRLIEPLKLKGSKVIFTCHTGDLFGNWVPDEHIKMILDVIKQCPQHTFLMLTKNPSRMRRFFCNRSIPENLWLGTTVTKDDELHRITELPPKEKGGHRWVSFEPLFETQGINRIALSLKLKQAGIEWAAIGMQTNPNIEPLPEVFHAVFEELQALGLLIFVKNNLEKFLRNRHEMQYFISQLPWRKPE